VKLVRVQRVEEMNEMIPEIKLDFVSDNGNRLSYVNQWESILKTANPDKVEMTLLVGVRSVMK